ncbi:F-box protein CPR1-like [Salvia hispanica]|uniref:F-box protein CPR1-like n=1 Tax=Salvia hispanica TaxID=49212 RepID=UPI0020098F59|nr:F-box protein CPR1-like [Salvia hispanica]
MGRESSSDEYVFGFGVSISGQYKIVRFHDEVDFLLTCQVYNLGIGQWKNIPIDSQLVFWYQHEFLPTLVNGNLHWLLFDIYKSFTDPPRVFCLDLETKLFKFFSCPSAVQNHNEGTWYELSALKGRLCFSDDANHDVTKIWCMKKYGDDKSWTKDYVIKRKPSMYRLPDFFHRRVKGNRPYNLHDYTSGRDLDLVIDFQNHCHDPLYPVKAFKDGGILLALHLSARLFYYSDTTKDIREIKKERNHARSNLVIHNPNFVSLKSLVMKNMRVKLL